MKLMTKELEEQFKQTGRQEGNKNPIVIAKYFCPRNSRTWYATEYDPENGEFFGLVDGHEKELGYFTLLELISIQGPYGLRIERDLHFEPTTCSELGLYVPFDGTDLDEYDPCMLLEIQYACGESKFAL